MLLIAYVINLYYCINFIAALVMQSRTKTEDPEQLRLREKAKAVS